MNGKMHQGNKSKLRTMGQPICDLPKSIRKCIERSRSHSPTNSATAILTSDPPNHKNPKQNMNKCIADTA